MEVRVKSSLLKNLLQYAFGFGLLGIIVWMYWNSRPGKTTYEEQALTLVAGAEEAVFGETFGVQVRALEVAHQPAR